MSLDHFLIKEFASVATPKASPIAESTVYGVAHIVNGNTYMFIDGSDTATPVVSTTDVSEGERVVATLKNHQLLITGNSSSPSVSGDTLDKKATEIKNDASEQVTKSFAQATAYVDGKLVLFTSLEEFEQYKAGATEYVDTTVKASEDSVTLKIQDLSNSQQEFNDNLKRFIHYGTTPGENAVTMGVIDNEKDPRLTVDPQNGIIFEVDGQVKSKMTAEYFETGSIYVRIDQYARFGHFAWVPRSDGSIMFLKVGNE